MSDLVGNPEDRFSHNEALIEHAEKAQSVKLWECALVLINVEEYSFEPQNHSLITCFTICVFWSLLLRVVLFLRNFHIFSYFYCFINLLHKT